MNKLIYLYRLGKRNLLSHNGRSNAAHTPPGLIWSSRSAGQYGCVSAGLCPMGCNYDPNGPNMDRNLGQHILSHSAHIGVHGEPFGSDLSPFPHPSKCTGAHSDRTCVPFSTHREAGVPIRIAIASDSAPTGVYGSQFLTSQKK